MRCVERPVGVVAVLLFALIAGQPAAVPAQDRPMAEPRQEKPAAVAPLDKAAPVAERENYSVGSGDVLAITVWNQMDLSGKFTIGTDGALTFPLIGKVNAEGLSPRAIEAALRARLADGYFQKPQVTVAVDEYHSQRIFVVGEVRAAGSYPLRGTTTLLEVLAQAGSATGAAIPEVVIVRPRDGVTADRPMLPTQGSDAEVLRVDVQKMQSGSLAENVALKSGDTIFVPRAENVFVYGQVRSPGSYATGRGVTVMQLLALAGGSTERGATNRITIVRIVKGKKTVIKAKLTDLVEPGDTVVVPERYL